MEKWLNQNANAKMLAACTWFQWFYRAFVFFFCCCCGFLNIHTTKYYLLCFDIRFPGFVKSDFSHRFYSAANRIVARINRMKQDTASRHHQNSWPNSRAPFLPFLIFFFCLLRVLFIYFIPWRLVATPQPHTNTLHNDFVLLMTRTGTKLTFAQLVSQCE